MQDNDATLVRRVLAGEKSVFGSLVERHQRGALRLALRLLGDPADAADVVQEALLQAFLGLHALRDLEHFGTWLLGIVVNLCRMHLRTQRVTYAWDDGTGGRVLSGFTWVETTPSPEALYEVRELHHMMLTAIATLPAAQQEAVRLYYLDGLTVRELSLLTRVPVGTVKARLHRARTRLRLVLGQQDTREQAFTAYGDEEGNMIAVTVQDVMMHVPRDEVMQPEKPLQLRGFKLWGYKKHGAMAVVFLKEEEGERILPIWMSPTEGNAVALHLAEVAPPRPMSFDFMVRLLAVSGMQVEKVAVTRLHGQIFYASLWVHVGDRMHTIDARPSDAINLALRVRAPIFVTPEVFDQASFSPERVLPEAEAQYYSVHTAADAEMELRSFRALL